MSETNGDLARCDSRLGNQTRSTIWQWNPADDAVVPNDPQAFGLQQELEQLSPSLAAWPDAMVAPGQGNIVSQNARSVLAPSLRNHVLRQKNCRWSGKPNTRSQG